MIIDTHYHYMPATNERIAAEMVRLMVDAARKMGLKPDYDALLKKAVETWGDPTGDRLIEHMDEAGIDVTVAVCVDDANIQKLTAERMQKANRFLGEVVKRHSKRVVGLAGIDPRRPEAVDMAKACFEEFGLRGIKYHPDNGFDPSSAESYKVFEILAKNKGVLLSHTSPLMPRGRSKFADPMKLSDIAVDFPEIKVIAAHMGGYVNWRSWGCLAAFQSTMYGDLAVWDNLAFHNYPLFCRELRTAIDMVGADKILFGSDAPVQTLIDPLRKWIDAIRDLPQKAPEGIQFTIKETEMILGENARMILGI